jgi:hypothetical protein
MTGSFPRNIDTGYVYQCIRSLTVGNSYYEMLILSLVKSMKNVKRSVCNVQETKKIYLQVSETLVSYDNTKQRHKPDEPDLNLHRLENLKSRKDNIN